MSEQTELSVAVDQPGRLPDPPQQALTVRDAVQALDRAPEVKAPITAAQAKIEAVANLTAAAYAKASELQLTPEESKALQADFPDEAFKPGAAGKENLIYIEHAFLRDRLNQVVGLGQWALIPRNRWAEDYRTASGKPASRVYVEAMLMVRGCFVSEAVGEMEYYPTNAAQNYGDAVEGAKTAALRRCCKEFGIGLQAWKKDWCEGWWQRQRAREMEKRKPAIKPAPPIGRTAAETFQHANQGPPPQVVQSPEGERIYPVCQVLTVKERKSPPAVKKPWTVYFITFNDGVGNFEAGTFDKNVADFANDLASTQENARLVTKLGRKEGTREIVSLDYAEQPPGAGESDNQPEPLNEVIP